LYLLVALELNYYSVFKICFQRR